MVSNVKRWCLLDAVWNDAAFHAVSCILGFRAVPEMSTFVLL